MVGARRSSLRFRPCPSVNLLSSEGFSRLEVDPDVMPGAWFGITDIKDCFHNMLIPEWLSDSFTLVPVTAKEVGIEGSTLLQNGCKVVLESETLVSPAWSALPMGCSWSFVFCSERDRDHCVSRPCVGRSLLFTTKRRIWSWVDVWVLKRTTCMWTIWV